MSLVLLLLAALTPPNVPDVSLDALRAEAQRYANRTVRVTGQVDQCWNMSCKLCPLESTPAQPQWVRCLEIGFDRYQGGERFWGVNLDHVFRYADIVATARFDPACFDICTDRGSVLIDARVERVTRRRRSRDGLLHRDTPLIDVTDRLGQPLLELFRPDEIDEEVRVFAVPDDPRIERGAIVCHSNPVDDEPAAWPVNWTTAFVARSTEDHYHCMEVRRHGSGWALDNGERLISEGVTWLAVPARD